MAVFCVKKFNCISHRILSFQFVIGGGGGGGGGGGVSDVPTLKTYVRTQQSCDISYRFIDREIRYVI